MKAYKICGGTGKERSGRESPLLFGGLRTSARNESGGFLGPGVGVCVCVQHNACVPGGMSRGECLWC